MWETKRDLRYEVDKLKRPWHRAWKDRWRDDNNETEAEISAGDWRLVVSRGHGDDDRWWQWKVEYQGKLLAEGDRPSEETAKQYAQMICEALDGMHWFLPPAAPDPDKPWEYEWELTHPEPGRSYEIETLDWRLEVHQGGGGGRWSWRVEHRGKTLAESDDECRTEAMAKRCAEAICGTLYARS